MEGVDLTTLQKLFEKGLVEGLPGQRPRLTEAGRLVRQLLVHSRHVEPNPDAWTGPNDILKILAQAAANFALDFAGGFVMKKVEERVVDGETRLVFRLNEGMGVYSEWEIRRSDVRRIG